ncbi:hypothetical protein SAMN05192550_0606 [Flavobacterium glycines]|uniref:Uncharacterized protein n=1 Tax=Flavobacterium glycines TaxID=551990 RepID=A0A1B9DNS8_9FLAO|nr:hypothetical protein [Flavobacterium glycines]OCB71347.1 hypothetical protein FBGL_08860 [Flavobacterium glycines]GEL10361.1 hypothetical protein FGL01_11000 [Flavobacterium glycines]SDI71083.1 hypothetical protein SAMN05192550_0606 [Flavobacterium glycines]
MKLTNEQIAIIDQTLMDKGVVYEEIKLELLDHIVTDIELETEESNFDVAFSKAILKWERELEEINPLEKIVTPRIVKEKFSKITKNQFKFSLLAVVIFSVLMTAITMLEPEEYVYYNLHLFFYWVFSLICLINIINMFFIWKLKTITIYGRFFQVYVGHTAFNLYLIYSGLNRLSDLSRHYSYKSIFMNFFEWFFKGFFFFMAVYLVMIAIEHFKTVKKYKLV